MNKYFKWLTVAVVVGVVSVMGAAVAFAQTATPPATANTPGILDPQAGLGFGLGPWGRGGGPGGRMGGPGGRGGHGPLQGLLADYQALLDAPVAEALGISVDELTTARTAGKSPFDLAQEKGVEVTQVQEALQAGQKAALAQAVTDGKITQAQADQMLLHGGPGGRGGRGGAMHGVLAEYQGLVDAEIAKALGMTVEELTAAKTAGKTLATLAQEKGVEVAKLQEAAQVGHAAALAQAVTDGKITQAQADQMLLHGGPGDCLKVNGTPATPSTPATPEPTN